jgi:hypothetical protein
MVPNTFPVVIWAEAGSALKTASAKAAVTDKTLCTIATPPDLTWTFCEIRHERQAVHPIPERASPQGAEQAGIRSRHIQNLGGAAVKEIRAREAHNGPITLNGRLLH